MCPLETLVGEWDEVFDVVRRATEAIGEYGSRVSLVLKADLRPGYSGELDAKIDRLESAIESANDEAGDADGVAGADTTR